MRGASNFAARMERNARDKIGSSAPRYAAAAPSLTRPARPRVPPSVIKTKGNSMFALYDHIQELRAELRQSIFRQERAEIEAELAQALAEQAERDRAFDRDFAIYCSDDG
jgi:hypothetical protein